MHHSRSRDSPFGAQSIGQNILGGWHVGWRTVDCNIKHHVRQSASHLCTNIHLRGGGCNPPRWCGVYPDADYRCGARRAGLQSGEGKEGQGVIDFWLLNSSTFLKFNQTFKKMEDYP